MFRVEKAVPLPPKKRRNEASYPFSTIGVGDSFVVRGDRRSLDRVLSAYYRYKAKTDPNYELTTRILDDRTGYRVWRVK
jgi:hypothetical protein